VADQHVHQGNTLVENRTDGIQSGRNKHFFRRRLVLVQGYVKFPAKNYLFHHEREKKGHLLDFDIAFLVVHGLNKANLLE